MPTNILLNNDDSLELIKDTIHNYYNSFMKNLSVPGDTTRTYFFSEMSNIGDISAIPLTKPTNTTKYSVSELNDFINACLAFKISDNVNDYHYFFKCFDPSSPSATIRHEEINNLYRFMNIINIFIDVLEAYKKFIDDNPVNFKTTLKTITKIKIVSKENRLSTTDDNKGDNYGYVKTSEPLPDTLYLSIKSLSDSDSAETYINNIFTLISSSYTKSGTTVNTSKEQFVKNNGNNTYINTENTDPFTYKDGTSDIDTKDNRDKTIFKNFLYFLINMDDDYCRMQVFALYYYYKMIRIYIFMVCNTMNITINNVTTSGNKNTLKLINSNNLLNSNDNIFKSIKIEETDAIRNTRILTIDNQTVNSNYLSVMSKIQDEISELTKTLYSLQKSGQDDIEPIKNVDLTFKASFLTDKTIKLDYSESLNSDLIKSIFQIPANVDLLKNKYVILYKGLSFTITDIKASEGSSNQYIVISGVFNLANTDNVNSLPVFNIPEISSDTSTVYRGIDARIISKGILSLKSDYNTYRNNLTNINTNIRTNITKINNQKNLYNYQKNRNELLNKQIYAFNAILGSILIGFLLFHIMNIDKGMKKMLSFVFIGIILLLILVYYVISSTYMEEDFTNFSNKNREHFEDFNILVGGSISYNNNKRNYLISNIKGINGKLVELMQKVMYVIPLSESTDFLATLNGIIKSENEDKESVNDILSFKKSMGYSNIDILKYEYNNKKVYITTLLATFIIFSSLYMFSLFLPDEYGSLLIFVGILFGIVLFSYYMIFANRHVRTKSVHRYWGPEKNKDF